MLRAQYLLLLLAAPLGCATAAATAPAEVEERAVVRTDSLGPGDVFEIRVFGESELTGIHRVGGDGKVDIPLAGTMTVARLSPGQLSRMVANQLREFVRNPQVSIFVKEYNSQKVSVFGKVRRPGTFPFEEGMNIVHAVTRAGGFDKLADGNGTFVTRLVDGQEKRIKVSVESIGEGRAPNFSLEPGDIVYVPESMF